MRARYFLGRYNYLKYSHLYSKNLIDIRIVSDRFYRTTMSADSELLGMLHEINKK